MTPSIRVFTQASFKVLTLHEGADWLQGPYIYSVYREQHDLPERLVALLFVLGFLTAGISAPAVGVWADQ